ncbi:MAG: hypothetical protein H0T73_11065 [Ardenticatenales bacterium]|nr:hypothetical protein [Ardenticatenales bacterium]
MKRCLTACPGTGQNEAMNIASIPLTTPLTQMTFVALDTETTGLSAQTGHRLVELAAVRFTLAGELARWQSLLWPHRPISPGAQRVHGLSSADLQGAPCFAEVATDFLAFVGESPLVMHNAPFDAAFLAVALAESGYSYQAPIFDTLRLLRTHFRLPSNRLAAAARAFRLPTQPTHRAADDAATTAQLFSAALSQLHAQHGDDLLRLHGAPYALPLVQLPPLATELQRALASSHPVTVHYGERISALVGQIEGIAQSRTGAYCTLRLATGQRLHLTCARIHRLFLADD